MSTFEDNDYRPNSLNAQIARLTALNENEAMKANVYRAEVKESLARLHSKLDFTNGRVNVLEREKWVHRGYVGAIGLAASAAWQWIVRHN
jgi:hypothetical protein